MRHLICLVLLVLIVPLLLAQPSPVNDGGTEEEGGNDGIGGFAPLVLGDLPSLNYSIALADEALTLKNTSSLPSTLVIYIQMKDWLTTSHTFRLESGQEVDFDPPETLPPVDTIRVLSMQPFEVELKEVVPLIGSSTETVLQAKEPLQLGNLSFIEDAEGQTILVGVVEDGSVHYPLFGKRIGAIENETVLVDGTQQRFELLE